MKRILLLLFTGILLEAQASQIKGTIGPYPVVAEIEKVNYTTGELVGKYRYTNKKQFINLKGEVMQNIIWMEESVEGKVTGHFYLEIEEGLAKGKWISDKSHYDVSFKISAETARNFQTKTLEEYAEQVSETISGGYGVEKFFLNDMWFREDNPQMEIGFNGGTLILEEKGKDSLRFHVNTICGPTYHIAFASGIAHRTGENTFGYLVEAYENDTCYVFIEMGEKSAHVWAKGNFLCGFGARAYLDHDFVKITDQIKYEEEVSIEEMKRSVD